MVLSRAEIAGFGIAIVLVAIMGVITFAGPFHQVVKNKPVSTQQTALNVKIVTDPKTVGRYVPATITAHVGQTIVFTNVSSNIHTVTARQGQAFNSGDIQTNGATWRFVPTKTGSFAYYCVYHPFMLGTIKVVS